MLTVGVRKLKARLSHYLKRVGRGERVVITDRGKPVALISPTASRPEDDRINALLRDGTARWDGKVPRGAEQPPRVIGPSVGAAVTEDRR